jgi:CheY-like chemotaxis protein
MGDLKTVLVVDDDWDSRFLIATALRHVGFAVVEACDGLEALEMARTHHPHAVVMDLMMPVLDGVVATIILRQLPAFQDLPVIALTAEDAPIDATHLFTTYLQKPVSPFHLATVVSKLVEAGSE